jgi:L-rhamnose mutarotase
MQRTCFVLHIRRKKMEEYGECHAAIWTTIVEALARCWLQRLLLCFYGPTAFSWSFQNGRRVLFAEKMESIVRTDIRKGVVV